MKRRTFLGFLTALPFAPSFIKNAISEEPATTWTNKDDFVVLHPLYGDSQFDTFGVVGERGPEYVLPVDSSQMARILRKASDPENEEALRKLGIVLQNLH